MTDYEPIITVDMTALDINEGATWRDTTIGDTKVSTWVDANPARGTIEYKVSFSRPGYVEHPQLPKTISHLERAFEWACQLATEREAARVAARVSDEMCSYGASDAGGGVFA